MNATKKPEVVVITGASAGLGRAIVFSPLHVAALTLVYWHAAVRDWKAPKRMSKD